jgi:hypothetical protein
MQTFFIVELAHLFILYFNYSLYIMAEVQATVNAAVCAMCSNHSLSSITRRIARMAITVNVRIAEG